MDDGTDKCPYSRHKPDQMGEDSYNRDLANWAGHTDVPGSPYLA